MEVSDAAKLLQDTGQLPQQIIVFVSRTKVEKMSVVPRLRNLGLSHNEEFSCVPNEELINPLPSQNKNCILKAEWKAESSIVCLKI